jgi:ABC-type transport system substrate-binding protein
MFLELKFGGIDVMGLTPPQYKLQADTELFNKYFQKFRYPAFGYTYLGYNLRDPRFSDKRIRKAITYAINKKDIIAGVLLGYGTPCTGPFPPESWAYNPDVRDLEYNPEKAKILLKEAGWEEGRDGILVKDGKAFEFTVLVNQGNDARLKTAQIIKENLKKTGIIMHIKVLEWQAMLHQFIDQKRFEAIIMGWGLSRDPDMYPRQKKAILTLSHTGMRRLTGFCSKGGAPSILKKEERSIEGFMKSSRKTSPIRSSMSLTPCRFFTKGSRESRKHRSVSGTILFIGMYRRIKLSGITECRSYRWSNSQKNSAA